MAITARTHSTGDSAEQLADNIAGQVLTRHATGGEDPQADRRVNVASGDGTNSISHRDERKPEGKSDTQMAHGLT